MNAIRNEIMYSVFLQRSKYQQLLDKKHGDEHIIGVIHGFEIVERILLEAEAAQDQQLNAAASTNNGMAAKRKKFSIKSAQMPRCCMECPVKKDTRCEYGWGGCGCKDKLARHFAMS